MTVLIVGAGPTGLMLACDLIPQWRTEEILADRFASLGGRVELDTELTGFTQAVDGVTAQTSCGPIRARYLVGCDGGRSTVRKAMGVPALPVRGVHGRRRGARADLDSLRRILLERSDRTNIRLHDLRWISLYQVNVRMVDRYRASCVLLAGDPALAGAPEALLLVVTYGGRWPRLR